MQPTNIDTLGELTEIARRVNAHDALVVACRAALNYWYYDWQGTGSKRDSEVYQLLTTALALVPGEKGETP